MTNAPLKIQGRSLFTCIAHTNGNVYGYRFGYIHRKLTPIFTPTPIPSGPLTIDYTYDALHRLSGATYSDGRSFGYSYDAAGNVLELQQNLGPGTVVTSYTYDDANQLETAQQGSTTWQYTYDASGSLTSDGVKIYAYDSANRLVEVSDPSGTMSMDYNGLGQRLSMDAAGVIAHYVLDGDQPLTAESSGNTTFYLYGLGAIAEKANAWSYSLPDGTNTPRHQQPLRWKNYGFSVYMASNPSIYSTNLGDFRPSRPMNL